MRTKTPLEQFAWGEPTAHPPRMHKLYPESVIRDLDYADMVALSEMYCRWAIDEPGLTPDESTKLILWSADYERLAEWVGPNWRASDPSDWPSLSKFLATLAQHHSIAMEPSHAGDIFTNFPPRPANLPRGSLYSKRLGLWKTPAGVIHDCTGKLVDEDPETQ